MKNTFKILNQADKTIILNPEKPLYSLIWLHGLGDTSAGFLDYFQLPQSPLHKGARVKLLHAPIRPVTINGGMKCPSWYDIKILSSNSDGNQQKQVSLQEVRQSLKTVDEKVQQEIKFWQNEKVQGDLYKRIFVGGFSQGCAISLLYGLTCKNVLGGVIGFSGYLFKSFQIPNLGKVPILLNHGRQDNMIPIQVSKKSYQKILSSPTVTYKQKDLDHQVSIEQIEQMTNWLTSKLIK